MSQWANRWRYITIFKGGGGGGGFYSRGRSTNNFDGEEGNGGEGGKEFSQREVVEDLEFGLATVGSEEVVEREESALEVEEEDTLGEAVEMVFMSPKG